MSIYLYTHASIYPSTYQPIYLSIYLSICPCITLTSLIAGPPSVGRDKQAVMPAGLLLMLWDDVMAGACLDGLLSEYADRPRSWALNL